MRPGRRDQRGELLEEREGIEPDGASSVAERAPQAVDHGAVVGEFEALGGDGGAGHVANEALQSFAVRP
jgi:hypothetical protein